MPDLPLLVYGPRSLDYDFGPAHPLTPRRFGPGIELLRAVGAEPGLAPEPASDEELLLCHTRSYLDVVRRFSESDLGWMEPDAGLGVGELSVAPRSIGPVQAALAGLELRAARDAATAAEAAPTVAAVRAIAAGVRSVASLETRIAG